MGDGEMYLAPLPDNLRLHATTPSISTPPIQFLSRCSVALRLARAQPMRQASMRLCSGRRQARARPGRGRRARGREPGGGKRARISDSSRQARGRVRARGRVPVGSRRGLVPYLRDPGYLWGSGSRVSIVFFFLLSYRRFRAGWI
ncbi:hypothetical protein BDA96_04G231400 [Sorghum bicolor]|uniref:Uncharacterized protein n=1 Tax=Sorghum bicolor TaxID=4558 RepID=A0A921R612_SORBI|nr:hypothetical protein BDA96_04G231400 [Sorghum bicolor]